MMTLTLKLTVTYEPNGVPAEELRSTPEEIANHAANRGMMTCDTLAEFEDWHAVVVEENDRRRKSTNTA